MSLWGNIDQANSVPKDSAELLNVGSGNANKQANTLSLYDNTTANTVHLGVTIAIVLVTVSEIATGNYSGAVAGWNIKRTFSGNRAGRVTYEPIVSMGSGATPPANGYFFDTTQQYFTVLGL